MNDGWLYVAVRDTEEYGRQWAIFTDLAEATAAYEASAYIVRNAPGEGPDGDLTIVTGAALYAAKTADLEEARAMTIDGRADLLEWEEWDAKE
jgi:hypothetical protein